MYSEAFERFWQAYPRKAGTSKLMAYRSWDKQGLDSEIESLLPLLEHMNNTEYKGREQQFIPHCVTFLNQRRWETVELPRALDLLELSRKPFTTLTADERTALGWRFAMGSGWIQNESTRKHIEQLKQESNPPLRLVV